MDNRELFTLIDMKNLRILLAIVILTVAGRCGVASAQTWTLTTLYSFSGGVDGEYPLGGLVQGSDGNFYGTTTWAGEAGGWGNGTVFKISSAGTLTTLYTFTGTDDVDGDYPHGGLIQGSDGNFYGTTMWGGSGPLGGNGNGTVFNISSAGTLTRLYSFTGGVDGGNPVAGLVQASDGNFYGTTGQGGAGGYGTVFKMSSAGTLTTLYSFSGGADGGNPYAGLVQGSDSNLYGTTSSGGTNGYGGGTVFKTSSAGTLTTLYSFSGGADGNDPSGGLVQGSDSNFYGTTYLGGTSTNAGTVFSISSAGTFTTLYRFSGGADGAFPNGLVQGSDGNFYGTTSWGGTSGDGTLFKISSAGTLTTLYSFSGGTNGYDPYGAGLVQGSDGFFYGTTYAGGTNGDGTVFKYGLACTIYTSADCQGGFPGDYPCGTVSGSGTYSVGSSATVCATPPAQCYFFSYWTMFGDVVSYSPCYTFTVSSNSFIPLEAYFEPMEYFVGTTASPVGSGYTVIEGMDEGPCGEPVNLEAWPDQCYTFVNWTDGNGDILSTSPSFTFVINSTNDYLVANFAYLTTDSVGDGVPDCWRQEYFGGTGTSTNAASCASCDADGTGQNNLFKFVAGLNPTDPTQVFVLNIASLPNQPQAMNLNFSPLAQGRTYTPQFSTNLASGVWLPLTTYVSVTNYGSQVTVSVTDTNPIPPQEFYRIDISLGATPTNMVLIPAGTFTMGDTLDAESDAILTNIYVSAFYMDVNLVSYSQWQSVYNWAINNGYGFDDAGTAQALNQSVQPVEVVNWYDVVKWSNARSQQASLTPVYYTDAGLTQVYTNGDTDAVYANWSANGYRLPTEAEWEKAARGGLSGQRFPWGLTISESQANYVGDTLGSWWNSQPGFSYDLGPNGYNSNFDTGSQPYTSPVGYFAPNGYGLYDMAGNAYEWCWDWYGTPYGQPTTTNPTGPASSSEGWRVLRGGDWFDTANYARCGGREYETPGQPSINFGFRCVRGH